ncbi:MAG: GrdX family protein [Clostridium sp.]|uniref:GrdX family protein n=1 Tax=Clostridium culturomicium TaxID=1499683 RepID=UPI00058D6602|nr:GrdX family protein [Clostridium culturomicium]MDU4890916.1 GrdX family protein [Clostridium sp.]MDU7082122.1 GrdX family protein [Clostridium sp.]
MIEPLFIITNNPMSKSAFENKYVVEYIENGTQIDILKKARDYVHLGNRLLTHPLMGSVKPNETPYRTICISKKREERVDFGSLDIIESAIATTEKFIRDFNTPNWSEKILLDFQVIDLDLIAHAIT